jgi:Photosynthetic reaction centre cytochrome C subunit
MSLRRPAVVAIVAAVVCAALATHSHAQIPDTFKNLEVLPKDIAKPELVRIMREFSGALGVRCIHCHKGDDPVDLSKVDFPSDEKENKRIARAMMGMTTGINATLRTKIGAMRPEPLEVTCFTCHHGNRRPETLQHALVTELDQFGVDSTLVKYRRLREEFYGRAAYDFSEWSLISIAENLSRDPQQAGASIAILNENLVNYPQSAGTYARLAETYLVMGDTTTAMSNFDKALAIAPDDPWLKRRVERLKGKK